MTPQDHADCYPLQAMSEAFWRVEDEALLRRLEDRTLFRSAWRVLVPDAAPPPPSASATVAELRLLSSGRAAFRRAEEGDLSALVACLAELPANDASPRLIHHLALLQERLAQHLSTDAASDAAIEAAARAWARSAELWLRLGHQEHYLGRLAEQVFGSALSPDERRQEVTELALQTVARLGETAVAAAPTLSPGGRIALAALTLVADRERAPDPSAPIERQAVRRARREVDRAVEAALVPICLLYTSPSPRDGLLSRMPSSA